MMKSTKIILAAISVTLIICIAIVGISIGIKKNNSEDSPIVVDPSAVSDTDLSHAEPSEEPSETEPSLSQQILGAWMDSAQLSGFEFFEGGKVTVTFINITLPFLDIPINGSANGTYTLEDSVLTMKYSIYAHTEVRVYRVSVSDNELTMINTEDNNMSTYQRVDKMPEGDTIPAGTDALNDDLEGSWVNAGASVKYTFKSDSSVNVTFINATEPTIANGTLNGTYSGIYISQDDKLIIQFVINGKKVTLAYTYAVTTNSLSLTDNNGNTDLYIREGTGSGASSLVSAEALIGTWKDSAGTGGYKFLDGGIVEITYVDFVVPVINMPINGKFKGTYSVNGNELTLRYSAVGKSITSVYTYTVNQSTLTLTEKESGKIMTYTK